MGVFLVFVDGVGLGRDDPAVNPFLRARLTTLPGLLGGRPLLLESVPVQGPTVWARAADACLGVSGLPQSATGQTTILTGVNAARAIGRHLNAYPTPSLRKILAEHSLFKQVVAGGGRAAFLNAYRDEFFRWLEATGGEVQAGASIPGPFTPPDAGQDLDQAAPGLPPALRRRAAGRYRPSASTVAVLAAGLPIRTMADLAAGAAVYHDITHWTLQARGLPVPPVAAHVAGERAARIAAAYDFAMYEHFLTDLAGHGQDLDQAVQTLETLDAFLGGIVAGRSPETTLLVVSDHGNLEDLGTKGHTLNPVPVLALGPQAAALVTAIADLTDVTPAVLAALGQPPAADTLP